MKAGTCLCLALLAFATVQWTQAAAHEPVRHNEVLEWNQIFIDSLIATNTPNSSSQRLGAIFHTAIFDAFNGIERRYTPLRVPPAAAPGASRRAAVVASAHTVLVNLFPTRVTELDASYESSLSALADDDQESGRRGGRVSEWEARQHGIAWGTEVALSVLAWRESDGFGTAYTPFTGGPAVGQWRPITPATAMSAQGLAFTAMFVLTSNSQFRPSAPRTLDSATYVDDLNTLKSMGRNTGSSRTDEQTALAPFWDGNATVHWNQAANQIARANRLSISRTNRLLAVLNIAMADTAFTIWAAKRFYGDIATEVTWRPATAIVLADSDGNSKTAADSTWLPLVNTPSHPEYPAGHPGLNGAAATVLLSHFGDRQDFSLSTTGQPNRTYGRISQARTEGNDARVWGGMHYPSTVAISDALGESIARHVNRNFMQRQRAKKN